MEKTRFEIGRQQSHTDSTDIAGYDGLCFWMILLSFAYMAVRFLIG